MSTTAITTFFEARRRYEKIIDDKNFHLPASKKIHKSSLISAVTPGPLAVICTCHLKIEQNALTADTLRVFFEGYAKKSLQGDDNDLAFLATDLSSTDHRNLI